MGATRPIDHQGSYRWLSFLFLISGFAALIYQIVWQRVLFAGLGLNIESVTIIVTLFMFGLGVGSLLGGLLSKRFPEHLPHLFFLSELSIGGFGIMSIPLMRLVSDATVTASLPIVALTTFCLLFIPTSLMGATLPILVTYLHNRDRDIGKTVGRLYFFNTAGSAIACFITAEVLFVFLGLQAAALCAALCNFMVGLFGYAYAQRLRVHNPVDADTNRAAGELTDNHPQTSDGRLRFWMILGLAAATGYLSLSQEILWVRAISYATGDRPAVFAHVVGLFLFGIAFGSLAVTKICPRANPRVLVVLAVLLSLSGLASYYSMPLLSRVMTSSAVLGLCALYLWVALLAFLSGGIFPLLCQYGIRSRNTVGVQLSWVYFANIIGCCAGPLLTGFVLLDRFPIEATMLYISVATILLGLIVWLLSALAPLGKGLIVASLTAALAIVFVCHDKTYAHILEKLHYKTAYAHYGPYKYSAQGRTGIVAVQSSSASEGDVIYSGGGYDGRFNSDPLHDGNGITRAYMIAALHPDPRDVLEIGMAGAAWSRVIANYNKVKTLTIVEINAAYFDVIKEYPEFDGVFSDPKVTFHIDDGRRWLKRNRNARFDLIVENAPGHQRSHTTEIVSAEFLEACKGHLKPGGVLYYNTTGSEDILYAAAKTFKHLVRFGSFIAVSDSPFVMSVETRRENLLSFRDVAERPCVKRQMHWQELMERLAGADLSDKAELARKETGRWFITDDNMATEYKGESRWIWLQLLRSGRRVGSYSD
jgi:spermidine synthase